MRLEDLRWVDNVRGDRRFGHIYDRVRGKTLCGRRIRLGHPWHDCGPLDDHDPDCRVCDKAFRAAETVGEEV